jgi:hypothetical protein
MEEINDILDSVTEHLAQLQYYIEPTGIDLGEFEEAGINGVEEIHIKLVPIESSIFADGLCKKIDFLPIEVVRSMCLASAYFLTGIGMRKRGERYSINFLLLGAAEIGFVKGMAFGARDRDSKFATYKAHLRHAKDPKQKDKALVRVCWDAWQRNPDDYGGKAEFANDMKRQFPNLISQPVIEGWCRTWEREN